MPDTTMYMFSPNTSEYIGRRSAQVVNGKQLTKSAYATTTPPPENIPDGYVARWTGNSWEVVEDHRQHLDSTGTKQGGTPYWLPSEGDDWQSQPRYTEDLGPLPEGAVTVQPEKSEKEKQLEAYQTELREKEAWLASKDYIGVKIATGRATVDDYAAEIATMTEYAARVEELRMLIEGLK